MFLKVEPVLCGRRAKGNAGKTHKKDVPEDADGQV